MLNLTPVSLSLSSHSHSDNFSSTAAGEVVVAFELS
jgi:hypothetical protein